jgi:hypothetical protein
VYSFRGHAPILQGRLELKPKVPLIMRYGLGLLLILCAIALLQTSTQPIQGPYPTLAPGPAASQQTMPPIQMPSPPPASGLPASAAPSSKP